MTPDIQNSNSPDDAQDVLALLQRQRDLYCELKSHSDQQDELIATGATDRLLSLLAQRQKLIDGLGEVSESLSPYRSRIASIADQAADGVGQQMRGLVEEVRELLESIIERDEKGKTELAAARDQVGGQVRQAAGAIAAAGAYGGNTARPQGSRFTQQKG